MGVYVPDEKGRAVLAALENPNYDWRTVEGLSRETGLDERTVAGVIRGLTAFSDQIVQSAVPDKRGRALFTTRRHYHRGQSFFNRLLSAMSDRVR